MLKEAISPQLRFELLVGDGRFLPPLCNRREIVKVFQQLFIICDREHNSGFLAGLVGEILQGFAHPNKVTPPLQLVESSNASQIRPG